MPDRAAGTSGPELKTRVVTVLWPAFLMAGVLEMLVFAVVDPRHLSGWGFDISDWSAAAVYTVSFFVFWGVIGVAAAMAVWLGGRAASSQPFGD
ncbi:MAG: hypothetical protein U1E89_21755 [Burkholderiaceae bacterium]